MSEQITRPATTIQQVDLAAALEGLFSMHEVRVLGAVSLFVGYLCVLLTKIVNLQSIYFGAVGVAGLIVLLISLGKDFDWRSSRAWFRCIAVAIFGLIITAPQLHSAWTVASTERQLAEEQGSHRIERLEYGLRPIGNPQTAPN